MLRYINKISSVHNDCKMVVSKLVSKCFSMALHIRRHRAPCSCFPKKMSPQPQLSSEESIVVVEEARDLVNSVTCTVCVPQWIKLTSFVADVFVLTVDVIALDKLDRAFSSLQDSVAGVIGVLDVVNLLVTVYDPLNDHAGALHNVNIPLTVDLIFNWLMNVYDRCDSLTHDCSHVARNFF